MGLSMRSSYLPSQLSFLCDDALELQSEIHPVKITECVPVDLGATSDLVYLNLKNIRTLLNTIVHGGCNVVASEIYIFLRTAIRMLVTVLLTRKMKI